MRAIRIMLAAATAICGVVLPVGAGAESAVAGPGPCAEPRTSLQRDSLQPLDELEKSRIELRGEPVFAVAGEPVTHFDPTDVAAPGVEGEDFVPPLQTTFTRSPCDAPDAGCFRVLEPTPPTLIIGEPPPTPEELP